MAWFSRKDKNISPDVVKKDIGYEWNNRAVGEALEVYYKVMHMDKEKEDNERR